jgi:hypothetical protein
MLCLLHLNVDRLFIVIIPNPMKIVVFEAYLNIDYAHQFLRSVNIPLAASHSSQYYTA